MNTTEKIIKERQSNIETQKNLIGMSRYFKWVYDIILSYLGNRILDIGCAQGNICQYFLDKEAVIGVDILDKFVEDARERFKDYSNFEAYKCDLEDEEEILRYKDKNIDTVTCLNILEHVKDDQKALKNIYKILQPKGKLILQVPAFEWLYGTLDEADLHYRRYNKKELLEKTKLAGFIVQKVFYFNLLGIFGWYLSGKILKDKIFSSDKGKIYNILIPLLKLVESIIHPPLGLSIFVIAVKP